MNIQTDVSGNAIPHIIKGELVTGNDIQYHRFATPKLNMDTLVWPRTSSPPAVNVPLREIIDILVELGAWLTQDPVGLVEQAYRKSLKTNPLDAAVLERAYLSLGSIFNKERMLFQIEQELGGTDVVDGWRAVSLPNGREARIRAYPSRLVHVIAGNAPGVAAMTVMWAAMTKGVHLIKLPSNDLHSAVTILRGLSSVAAGHPLSQSFSAAYWQGGDRQIESMLFQPLFFDKLIAWGGETTIRNAKEYVGPGFELVSFDPKTSISLIGSAAHESVEVQKSVAAAAASDATVMNQQACVASRFQFVEGTAEQVDTYCTALLTELGMAREMCSASNKPITGAMKDEIEALRFLEPDFRVFGKCDGKGLVIRSNEPVDFQPDNRVVNVVRVDTLADAIPMANVATQTVGVYPQSQRIALRDALAAQGVQRIVGLGLAGTSEQGLPHDGFRPLQRFVRWVNDEP